MRKDAPQNLAASVRQRLQNLARQHQEDFQLVLGRFALERLLYRISHPRRLERPQSCRSGRRNNLHDVHWPSDESVERNTRVECGQLAAAAVRQPGEIQVGYLPMPLQLKHVVRGRIG
jgi:hypothetical protein